MSTEKFTPGEWEISDMSGVDAMDNFTVCFHIGVSSTGEMIADIQSDNKADYEHVRANAYLMKAAPELYKELSRECVICKLKDHNVVCDFCRIGEVLKKARGENE